MESAEMKRERAERARRRACERNRTALLREELKVVIARSRELLRDSQSAVRSPTPN